MKKVQVIMFSLLAFAGFALMPSCSAPPLEDGYSRFQFNCVGYVEETPVRVYQVIDGNNVFYKDTEIGCIVYGEDYIDVPVPPNTYLLKIGGGSIRHTFGGPGETKEYWQVFVSYSGSTEGI